MPYSRRSFASLRMTIYLMQVGYWLAAPLSLLTMRLETFTGSKSDKVRLVRHARSESFQRASGVPIRPPLSPLSARMMP